MCSPPGSKTLCRSLVGALALFLLAPGALRDSRAAQGQRPVFRGAVDLVRVDVIVTDEEGRFIDDLKPEDFSLYEDERRQELVDVQLVDLRRGVVQRVGADTATGGSPGAVSAVIDNGLNNREASELGAVVFLIDGTTVDMANKARFADAMRELIADTGNLRVPRAAYMVDSDRHIRQIVPFTFDTAQLEEGIDVLEASSAFGNAMSLRMNEVSRHLASRGLTEPGIGMTVRSYEADELQRSFDSLMYLTQFSRALGSRPGRKALVWVSQGVKLFEGGPYAALLMEAVDRGMMQEVPTDDGDDAGARATPSRNVASEWLGMEFSDYTPSSAIGRVEEELHEAANSANVSIYAVDPSAMAEIRGAGLMAGSRSPAMADLMNSARVQSAVDGMRDSLRNAAAATGGRAFIHWTDLRGALSEIEEDTSRFYLLAYEPASPEDGEYHDISVEVTRPGLAVRERKGYLALGAVERTERAISAALQLPGAVKGLDVSAEVFKKWNTLGDPVVQLAVSVEGLSPVIADSSGGDISPLRLLYMALDDGQSTIRRADQEVRRRPAGEPGTEGGRFVYLQDDWWSLDPGTYEFRVVVLDPMSGHVGATLVEVEIPERSIGWKTSDLMLGTVDETGATRPVVGGKAPQGQQLLAFTEVYGAAQPVAGARILSYGNGPDPELLVEIAAAPLQKFTDNIHRAAVILPDFLDPGRYVVELVVIDFSTRQERVLTTTLEVTAAGH